MTVLANKLVLDTVYENPFLPQEIAYTHKLVVLWQVFVLLLHQQKFFYRYPLVVRIMRGNMSRIFN